MGMKLNASKYARQDEHKLSHLEIPLIMSPSEDGRKWSVLLLLGFLPLFIIPFLISLFLLPVYFPLLLSLSKHCFQDFSLHWCLRSQSFISLKMDLLFPPVFYCIASVSLSCLLLTWIQTPVDQWAYCLLMQSPCLSLSFVGGGVKLSVLCLVAQSCLTLCDPIYCSPPGASVHRIFQARMLELGCHADLQEIFLTQGLDPGLRHCRWILYCLSPLGELQIQCNLCVLLHLALCLCIHQDAGQVML